jgi:hypothetical protein
VASSKIIQALPLYESLMKELKARVDVTNAVLKNPPALPGPMIQEFCLLQVRMVCELIALGCLVAHGDINEANKLEKTYQADKILSTLEALHPDFFPVAVRQRLVAPGRFHLVRRRSGFLTKPEFFKLYNQTCGNALHRGSLKHLLASRQQLTASRQDIADLIAKIVTLLDHHQITLTGGNTVLICGMVTKETGQVQVMLADAQGDVATPV